LHSVLEVVHRTAVMAAAVGATGFDQMIKNVRSCQTRQMFRDAKRNLPRHDRPWQQLLANSGGSLPAL
jgi:hypothetical protein